MSTTSELATKPATIVRPVREQTPFGRFLSDFFESRIATAAVAVFALILFVAIFAPWISPQDPYDLMVVDVMNSRMQPGEKSLDGMTFVLGSDGAGRDMLSAIFYGLRTSLGVGVMSAIIALCIGMTVGLSAAYFGGRTDSLIMRIVDLQLSFPAILIALILLSILGKGVDKIIIALVIAQWAYYARTVRASALVERRKEYIEAATCLALSHRRIVFRHLLPNVLPPLIVVGTLQTAHA
ncbi:MAG: ABC transporter permease, partial [Gammaproteobacteria bacterium]|nr:ABC transporter permease [Gammaproteobacteria bacterium]